MYCLVHIGGTLVIFSLMQGQRACVAQNWLMTTFGGGDCNDEYLILYPLILPFLPGKLSLKWLMNNLKRKGIIWVFLFDLEHYKGSQTKNLPTLGSYSRGSLQVTYIELHHKIHFKDICNRTTNTYLKYYSCKAG